MDKVFREVTRFGTINKTGWVKLRPLSDPDRAFALRIYREHGAQAKGEPYGSADELRAANGTVAEAQFAWHYNLPWSGGVTVERPRDVVADVASNLQVYTSGEHEGRLIVHWDELIDGQRWIHLAGCAPDDLYFVGFVDVSTIKAAWPDLTADPRRTPGGRVVPRALITDGEKFNGW